MINERYEYIKDYDNKYIITETGNVYSLKTGKLKKLKLKGLNNKKRYLTICLCKDNLKKDYSVHRLVAFYFCNNYFDGAVVNHKDTNIHNNHFSNLEWVTQKQNVHLSYKKLDQYRNCFYYVIIYPNGEISDKIKGMNANLKEYIITNELNVSYQSLKRYKKHNGFILQKLNKT